MNTVSIASIKRSGMNAIEAALASGPAFVMKRNRAAAVMISPSDYQALLTRIEPPKLALSAWDLLLRMPPNPNGLEGEAMAARLRETSEGWNER